MTHLPKVQLQTQKLSYDSKQTLCQSQNAVLQDLVWQFLDQRALCKANISLPETQSQKEKHEILQIDKETSSAIQPLNQTKPKKKSIFHNFQKHLITLLKNTVKITETQFQDRSVLQLCHKMWLCFKKTHSSNKQVLHMVFGLAKTKENEGEFKKIIEKYQEFDSIYSDCELQKVAEAQNALRGLVVSQLGLISREELQTSCNIQKFDVFYEYLQSFMLEIAEGPMTSRMLKSRKSMVVTKLTKKN